MSKKNKQPTKRASNLALSVTASAVKSTLVPVVKKPDYEVEQNWAEVDEIYSACADSLYSTAEGVNQAITAVKDIPAIPNIGEFNVLVKGLNKDLIEFTDQLVNIKKIHEGKSGVIKDPNEVALSMSVFEDYLDFNVRFKAIVFPTVMSIMEHVGTIAESVKKASEEAPATIVEEK